MTRSRWITLAATLALVSGCGSVTPTPSPSPSTAAVLPTAVPTATPTEAPTPTPTPTALPGVAILDGSAVDPAVASRLPVAVMIDDNAVARPQQYGFNAASIVYQAPADGGEDRYMMVFQEADAPRVEPIRSGRPYFVNWASEYHAAFAHYGGDAKTLKFLPLINGNVLWNVDAILGSGSIFHRDSTHFAPHNAVGSTAKVRALAISRGAPADMPAGLGLRLFAPDLPLDQRPASGSITIPYNTGTTAYAYDQTANQYLRSVAGRPQLDAADGIRVTARNVVVLWMALSIDPESEPGYARPVLAQLGTGKALVFRDGHVIKGTWRKATATDLTRFFDESGKEISLVPGRLFIQVVPNGTNVTYDAAS